ncbi:ABC transporter ATP-binding protein [Nocardia caishijiensis]|uniref:Peptide/nickel transport system ATP-binding protein n=1 Tax=Nocardia caishijiensis TaxID=184756 RepID=A0ABQ6YRC1_9NOCA|nr:ABC transporter ATP-binding protein [Nocardia caishijiensis]KAF0847996.1 peptide/nickel transport system ATP-binding protein [Nocardia caishijiensis]
MSEKTSALAVAGLSVTFTTDAGPVHAVRDVSYEVFPGEVLAIVGESGSGKSVSSRTAIGLLPHSASVRGLVTIGDRPVTAMTEKQLTALRGGEVSMVFQEPARALDPLFTVGFQICEALRAHSGTSRKAARAKAVELLRSVGLPDPEHRVDYYPHQLSGGQKQRVMIAIAISCEPKVIIADEPTTALDVTVQAEILDLLRDLRDRLGSAIVLITHNMGVVADLADRVVVMRAGEVVEQAPVHELFASPRAEYTRALLDAVPHLGSATARPTPDRTVEPVLDVRDLVVTFPGPFGRPPFRAVDTVSLQIRPGETLGLVGESGSGKSTIGRCVAALQRPTEGQVLIRGQDIADLSQRKLRPIRRRFGFVFQDPAGSLNPRLTVGECVAEPLVVHGVGDKASIRERVRHMLDDVHLPAGTENRYPHELSGGQRQRASLARALVLDPDLLVADEPTSALDVSVQAAVLELFAELQRGCGWACLFISHDLAVVDQLADRIMVLRNGTCVEEGDNEQILRNPRHEYTQRLVAAVPVPDPVEQRRRRTDLAAG